MHGSFEYKVYEDETYKRLVPDYSDDYEGDALVLDVEYFANPNENADVTDVAVYLEGEEVTKKLPKEEYERILEDSLEHADNNYEL